MLVESPDGHRALLGRNKKFAAGMCWGMPCREGGVVEELLGRKKKFAVGVGRAEP